MVLPRPFAVPRVCTGFVCAALIAAFTSTAWAGAVTASGDDPAPSSRLPVDRGSPAPAPRVATSSASLKNPAAQARRCGEGHTSTPRS